MDATTERITLDEVARTPGRRRAAAVPARPLELMRVRLIVRIVLEVLLCILVAGVIVVAATVGMAVQSYVNRDAPRPAYCSAPGDARQSLPVCTDG
jgi:hypothetical protein